MGSSRPHSMFAFTEWFSGWEHNNMPQQKPQLHSCPCHSLDADSARCEIRREGGRLSEMLHYVTGGPRIVPVCPARRWCECDVQNLTVVGSNPGETGALLFPHVRHTQPHTHTDAQTRTHMEPFKVFPSATVQNAPRINAWSRSGPVRPVIPIREGLWRNAAVMKGSGFQMFPSAMCWGLQKVTWNFQTAGRHGLVRWRRPMDRFSIFISPVNAK